VRKLEYKTKYNHWMPKILKVGGITLLNTVYFSGVRANVSARLVAHEEIHIKQINTDGYLKFYWTYLLDYLKLRVSGLGHNQAYRSIPYEKEAYGKTNHL